MRRVENDRDGRMLDGMASRADANLGVPGAPLDGVRDIRCESQEC